MRDAAGRLAVTGVRAAGWWCQRSIAGEVTLFVEGDEVVVRVEANGEELPLPFQSLDGAEWRAGVLELHMAGASLRLADGVGLDRAWHAISARACALPEMARGLRALGLERGAHAGAQARFFAPLLQARRRLEGDEPVDWKVAGFDVTDLATRLRGVLAMMAQERHADRAPYRRAVEAGLLDAAEPMFQALAELGDVARDVHDGADARRFVAWRRWASQLRVVFVQADRAWHAVATVLADEDRHMQQRPG
jgi:hypothetical protein